MNQKNDVCSDQAPEDKSAQEKEIEGMKKKGPEEAGGSSADGSATEEKQSEEAVEKQPEALSKEEEDLQTRYMRLAADFQNFKKRTEKEKNSIYARANEKIVMELLEVADNFERALEHTGEENKDAFAEGMNLIFTQLKGVLEKSGVEVIQAEGELFDPNFHHAVLTVKSVEYESGKVTQVLQRGYLLNGKVIRPAMVKVAE